MCKTYFLVTPWVAKKRMNINEEALASVDISYSPIIAYARVEITIVFTDLHLFYFSLQERSERPARPTDRHMF